MGFFWEHRLEGVGSESAEYRPAPVTLSNPQEEPDSREAGGSLEASEYFGSLYI